MPKVAPSLLEQLINKGTRGSVCALISTYETTADRWKAVGQLCAAESVVGFPDLRNTLCQLTDEEFAEFVAVLTYQHRVINAHQCDRHRP